MTFAIKRTCGKYHSDYLHAWDEKWGTSGIGSIKKAMTFATKAEADAAAARAQVECKGADGQQATGVTFSVVEIDSPAPATSRCIKAQLTSFKVGGREYAPVSSGDALAIGHAIHEKVLARFPMARVNGAGTAGPDITGINAEGRAVEGDFIPAQPKLTADELRSLMAYFAVPHHVADSWAHGHSEPVACVAKPLASKRPSSIVSISQAELDQLLAPYISAGLLRTIYTAATSATEYRDQNGKVIAISLRGNHYRNRDAVLGSTPSLHAQCIGRVRRAVSYDLVNPKTGEVVGGGTIPGNVTILHGSV